MKILFLVIAGEEIRTGEPQYQTMPHVSVWIFLSRILFKSVFDRQ